MWSTKVHSSDQITQTTNLVAKRQFKSSPTEIKPEKEHTFTQPFLLNNHYSNTQTDTQTDVQTESKNRGT